MVVVLSQEFGSPDFKWVGPSGRRLKASILATEELCTVWTLPGSCSDVNATTLKAEAMASAFTPIPNLSGAQRSAMMGTPSAHYLLPHQPAQVPELP